jgi:hypothetical protein
MKKYLTLTIAIMMFVAVMAVTAEAQVFGTQRVRARIPFAFNVGDKSLPAGEYTIAVLNPTSDRKVLQIRSTDGRLSALIQTMSATVAKLSKRNSCSIGMGSGTSSRRRRWAATRWRSRR